MSDPNFNVRFPLRVLVVQGSKKNPALREPQRAGPVTNSFTLFKSRIRLGCITQGTTLRFLGDGNNNAQWGLVVDEQINNAGEMSRLGSLRQGILEI